jgi:integrase
MGVKVTVDDGKVWIRINHRSQRKSKLVGPDSKATRLEAEKAAAIIAGKLAADDLTPLAPSAPSEGPTTSPKLAALASEWLDWHQKHYPRRASTQKNYQAFIDARLLPALGERRVSTVTRAVVQDFIATMRADGVAFTTLRSHYVPVFRKVLDYAVEKGHLSVNPFRSGGRLFEPSDADREAAPRPDPFSPNEMTAILGAAEHIDPEFGLLIRTWSQAGTRSGEVRALMVKDLDLQAGSIRIERTLHEQQGGKITVGPPKNLRGKRTASLLYRVATDREPEALLKALVAHVKGKAADAFVFEKPTGGPVTNGSLKDRWARALDLAGVRYREPEQLRHTFISTALSRGENALKITKQTGHSLAVLYAFYAEFVPEAADASARKPAASRLRRVS